MTLADFDSRYIAFVIWGIGTVLVYGFVLYKRRHTWALHHDIRSARDLVEAGALFLVAIASAAAIFMVLFGEAGVGLRPFFTAVALGSFTGAGLVMATERMQHDPAEDEGGP